MAYFDLLVTYINELDRTTPTGDDWLRIVQADRVYGSAPKTDAAFIAWMVSTGRLDNLGSNAIDQTTLFNQYKDLFYGPCGGGDGTLMIGLKVIKSRADLDYKIKTSYGGLKFNGTIEEETEVHLDIDLTNEITIDDHRILKLLPYNTTRSGGGYVYPGVFEGGNPWDKDGQPVTRAYDLWATWDEDEQTVTFKENLLGTYRMRFMHEYDSYTLTIPPRVSVPDIYDIDMIYDSTVWAFYSDKYAKKEIEIPDEARNCPVYGVDSEGNTFIYPGSQYGFDTDGDGEIDGGSDDPCACPFCAGTGTLLDCVPSDAVDCTCPYCDGTGIIPGCRNEEESGDDDGSSTTTGQSDGSGICYELRIRRNRCTGEIISKQTVEVPCPSSDD